MFSFVQYVNSHEDWLMGRTLDYARRQGYTKYTSTLKEPWRLSISGLSQSFTELIHSKGLDIEIYLDEDCIDDPATQFGIREANLHRERGTSLEMFLGMSKYYRQAYQDLVEESAFSPAQKKTFQNLINRFFDRVEIAFCSTWANLKQDHLIAELQERNRSMTNEKNKYLTIFESLSEPAFIIDPDGRIENMNLAGSSCFDTSAVSGAKYYAAHPHEAHFCQEFPWLADLYDNFIQSQRQTLQVEKVLVDREKFFHISFSRSLDISGKFSGTIVIISDITKRKILESKLEKMAATDPLTEIMNRRSFIEAFEQELSRNTRYKRQLALLLIDIDHFKDINDSFGHNIGDEVLIGLVVMVQNKLRASDVFGRWGGEEFIVMLPETDPGQATIVANRLLAYLAATPVHTNCGKQISLTVSIGMTVVNSPATMHPDIIKTADKALYLAKSRGRNNVVLL